MPEWAQAATIGVVGLSAWLCGYWRGLNSGRVRERSQVIRYLRNVAGSWIAFNGGNDLIVASEAIQAGVHRAFKE